MAQAKRGKGAGHPSPEPPPLHPRAPRARQGYRGWEALDEPTLLALGSPCHCVRHPEAPMPWAQEDTDPAHAPLRPQARSWLQVELGQATGGDSLGSQLSDLLGFSRVCQDVLHGHGVSFPTWARGVPTAKHGLGGGSRAPRCDMLMGRV